VLVELVPCCTIVDMDSSGHWTVIVSAFDCPIVAAIVLAIEEEPPAETESPTDFVVEAPGPTGGFAPTFELAVIDTSAENDFSSDLVVESLFELLKPVCSLTEAPCVLLATMRQKPRIVLSCDASGANCVRTSAESV